MPNRIPDTPNDTEQGIINIFANERSLYNTTRDTYLTSIDEGLTHEEAVSKLSSAWERKCEITSKSLKQPMQQMFDWSYYDVDFFVVFDNLFWEMSPAVVEKYRTQFNDVV